MLPVVADVENKEKIKLIYDAEAKTYRFVVNELLPKGQGVTIPFKIGQNPTNDIIRSIMEDNEWSITNRIGTMTLINDHDDKYGGKLDSKIRFILNDEFKAKRKSESMGVIDIELTTITGKNPNGIEEKFKLDLTQTEIFINFSFGDPNPITLLINIEKMYNNAAVNKLEEAGLIIGTSNVKKEGEDKETLTAMLSVKLTYSYAIPDILMYLDTEIKEAIVKRYILN